MASKQEDAPVEVPEVTEGMVSVIEGSNETNGDTQVVKDEIIKFEVNEKGTSLELIDDTS